MNPEMICLRVHFYGVAMRKFDYHLNKMSRHRRLSRKGGKVHRKTVNYNVKKYVYYDMCEDDFCWGRKMERGGVNLESEDAHWTDMDINSRCKQFTGVYPE